MHPLAAHVSARASEAGLVLESSVLDGLLAYYDILQRWNATINLTSLSDPDEAIDRLLLEPVAAARVLGPASDLIDLGSGGGSPAIPLSLVLRCKRLVMVESRGRKASFLREAARAAGIPATVEAERFEKLAEAGSHNTGFDVVSMRAVRMDLDGLESAARFRRPTGVLALFVTAGSTFPRLRTVQMSSRTPLLRNAELICLS